MNEPKPNRASNPPTVIYMQQRKPLVSADERKRQAESLRTYRPDGDAS